MGFSSGAILPRRPRLVPWGALWGLRDRPGVVHRRHRSNLRAKFLVLQVVQCWKRSSSIQNFPIPKSIPIHCSEYARLLEILACELGGEKESRIRSPVAVCRTEMWSAGTSKPNTVCHSLTVHASHEINETLRHRRVCLVVQPDRARTSRVGAVASCPNES